MARMNPKDATNYDFDIQNVKYKAVFLSTEECETLAFAFLKQKIELYEKLLTLPTFFACTPILLKYIVNSLHKQQ